MEPPSPLPENAGAWAVFDACRTQWAYATAMHPGTGAAVPIPTGLPAERVEAKARGYAVTPDADFWARFEFLEACALAAMAEERDARGG